MPSPMSLVDAERGKQYVWCPAKFSHPHLQLLCQKPQMLPACLEPGVWSFTACQMKRKLLVEKWCLKNTIYVKELADLMFSVWMVCIGLFPGRMKFFCRLGGSWSLGWRKVSSAHSGGLQEQKRVPLGDVVTFSCGKSTFRSLFILENNSIWRDSIRKHPI